jgi:hypothetical protein
MNNILFPMNTKYIRDIANLINSKNNKIHYFGIPKNTCGENEFYNAEKVMKEVFYSKKKKTFEYKFKINDKKKYEYYKNIFNLTSKRIFIDKSIIKDKDIFYEMCSTHYDFIKKNNISHITYWASPHFHFGVSLFCVGELLNLKQYILHETGIDNTFIIRKNWFSHHKYMMNRSNHKIIYKYFEKNVISNKAKKSRILRLDDLYGKKFFLIHFFIFLIKKILRIILIKNNNDKDAYFIYLDDHPRLKEAYLRSRMLINQLYTYFYFNYFISKKKVNLKEKYIYFSLHVEPERTMVPEGGIFHDQIRAIKLLRKSIPSNVKIYAKEHPNQFWLKDACIDVQFYKGIQFYKEIKKIKNVELISNKTKADQLIKNAICTATITGTAGWESIRMNNKAIAFGFPWYSDHKDCLCITSDNKETQKTIYEFLFKKKITGEKYFHNYLKFINKYLLEAETWENFIKAPKNLGMVKKLFAKKFIKLF